MLSVPFEGVVLAAAPQAINVDFDLTFVVQIVLFVALTLVLKPLLFDPMMKVFEERERLIDGVRAQARLIDEKSVGALSMYESAMAKARAEGNEEREKTRAEGVLREQEILAVVRNATLRMLEDGKRAASVEAEKARASLKAETATLARQLAARVLEREVPP